MTGSLVPPSPSCKTKRTVRSEVSGSLGRFSKVMLRASAWVAAMVAFELSVMTNGVEPTPPVKDADRETSVTSHCCRQRRFLPGRMPSLLIANRSLAVPPAKKSMISRPPSKFGESISCNDRGSVNDDWRIVFEKGQWRTREDRLLALRCRRQNVGQKRRYHHRSGIRPLSKPR